MKIQSGVPQGSILGPILFLIYINDIAYSCPDLNIDLYADDSTCFRSGINLLEIETKLQTNLDNISKWCNINNMTLHPKKTKCMIIGSKQKVRCDKQLILRLKVTVLENVTCHKVLGVIVDNNLNWRKHIDYVCKALNNKISLHKHILYYLTDEMKLLFYNAYLLPVFDYCCTIWGKDYKSYINKINILQKRAAKLILNKPI